MAGTGHPYEIGNPSVLGTFLSEMANEFVRFPEIAHKFRSRSARRYFTQSHFILPFEPEADGIEQIDPQERPFIDAKIKSGQSIFLFARRLVEGLGPDFVHVRDFLNAMRVNDAVRMRQLRNMDLPTIFNLATFWRGTTSLKAVGDALVRDIIVLSDGLRWVELLNRPAMIQEGQMQAHCVGDLDNYRAESFRRYFSLRDFLDQPLVTAEFTNEKQPECIQIKSFANGFVPFELQHAALALFEILDSDRTATLPAASAGLAVDAQGRWYRMADQWEPLIKDGVRFMTSDTDAVVFSPVKPDQAFLLVRGFVPQEQPWYLRPVGDKREGLVHLIAARHHHIEELRVLCSLCETFGLNHKSSSAWQAQVGYNGYNKPPEPLVDRMLEKLTSHGTSYLQDGDSWNVSHSSDKARLIAKVSALTNRVMTVHAPDRVSASEFARILDVASHLDVVTFAAPSDKMSAELETRFLPRRLSDGSWINLRKVGVRRDVGYEGLFWLEAPGIKVLHTGSGKVALDMVTADGTGHVTSSYSLPPKAWMEAVIAEAYRSGLNRLTTEDVKPTLARVFRLNGEWHHLETPDQLAVYLAQDPSRADSLTLEECRNLDVLTEAEEGRACFEPVLLRSLCAWLSEQVDKPGFGLPCTLEDNETTSSSIYKMRPLHTVAGRLVWLGLRTDNLTEADHALLRAVVKATLKALCKQPARRTNARYRKALIEIVAHLGDFVTTRQTYSAALRCLSALESWTVSNVGQPLVTGAMPTDNLTWLLLILDRHDDQRLAKLTHAKTWSALRSGPRYTKLLAFDIYRMLSCLERLIAVYPDAADRIDMPSYVAHLDKLAATGEDRPWIDKARTTLPGLETAIEKARAKKANWLQKPLSLLN